jgi:putative inorganic carbon (HCO3(-)) transporter
MRNKEYLTELEPVIRSRRKGWWQTEHAGASEWPASRPVLRGPGGHELSRLENENGDGRKTEDAKRPIRDSWIMRRGHTLSYAGLFLFTAVLYFRPYELIPALAEFASLAFWIAAATLLIFVPSQLLVEGNFTARPREVKLILLLAFTALLSIPFAINKLEAWQTFNDPFAKAVAMFIVMVNVVRTERRLKGMFVLSLAVGCFISFGALRNFHLGVLTTEGYRVPGSGNGMFANPNDMALYLVTVTPIAIALCLAARGLLSKIVYAFCTILLVGGNMVTYSRGGFLGLLAVAGVLVWKLGRRNRFAISIASLVLGAVVVAFAPGGYGKRLISIFLPNLDAVGSSTARKELLKRSLLVAARHPFFGIGMGNFHIVSIHEQVSHNAYTQVSAELGVAALVFYVLLMITPLKRLKIIENETFEHSSREEATSYYLAIGLQASIIGYMVSSFFVSVAYLWYIYYLVGFAVALRRIYEVKQVKRAQESNPTGRGLAAAVL